MKTPEALAAELAELLGHPVEARRCVYLRPEACMYFRTMPGVLWFGTRLWRERGGAVPLDAPAAPGQG